MSEHYDPFERLRYRDELMATLKPEEIALRVGDCLLELHHASEDFAQINVAVYRLMEQPYMRRAPKAVRELVEKIQSDSLHGNSNAIGMMEVGLPDVVDQRGAAE